MIDWTLVRTHGLPSQVYLSARRACNGDFFGSLLRAPLAYRTTALQVLVIEMYRLDPTDAHATLVGAICRDPTSVMDI